MNSLDIKTCKSMLIFVFDAIAENKEYLTEVDSVIGDGDHGTGMVLGTSAAKKALINKDDFININELFKTAGMEMINTMGGASGVIFGSMFLACKVKGETYTEIGSKEMAKMFRNSLEKIKAKGGASVGDKTMVDALEPAVIAMENNKSDDLVKCLELASKEAKEGLEATKNYLAKFGRAQYLGERSLGHQDAGATSVYIIFDAMYRYLKSLEQ